MNEISELKKALQNHEERISKIKKRLEKIEKVLFSDKPQVSGKMTKQKKYSGLVGGLEYLIDNGFFSKPKLLKEIVGGLKVQNYHYSMASISKILARDFVNKKRILNRIKEGKNYMYVIRK